MAGGRLWTAEDEAAVRARPLRAPAGTLDRLAAELGRSRIGISIKRSRLLNRGPPRRWWTAPEDRKLRRLRADGLTWAAIAARMGRTYASVRQRHAVLAR